MHGNAILTKFDVSEVAVVPHRWAPALWIVFRSCSVLLISGVLAMPAAPLVQPLSFITCVWCVYPSHLWAAAVAVAEAAVPAAAAVHDLPAAATHSRQGQVVGRRPAAASADRPPAAGWRLHQGRNLAVGNFWPAVEQSHRGCMLPDDGGCPFAGFGQQHPPRLAGCNAATSCSITAAAAGGARAEVDSETVVVWVAGCCHHPEGGASQAPCLHVLHTPPQHLRQR